MKAKQSNSKDQKEFNFEFLINQIVFSEKQTINKKYLGYNGMKINGAIITKLDFQI